ncbi:MAG TPA: YjiH family protein [Bacillota bacterium]|nr:YjiH family protein [Bacillota bacterium]
MSNVQLKAGLDEKNDQNPYTEYSLKRILRFVIPSLIGILFFLTPIKDGDKYSILVAILSGRFSDTFISVMPYVVYAIILTSAAGVILAKAIKPKFILENESLNNLFNVSPTWSVIRIAGAVITVMCMHKLGPEMIISADTGMFLIDGLLVYWMGTILFAGFFMTFLMDYGLLEFTGVFASKVFRPLFTLPGRSAVDCMASWVGDAIVGVLLTTNQFEQGYYSRREAATIATTFSAVSIAFAVIVITQVGLEHMFFQFLLTTAAIGVICGIIMPRIPPLSLVKDDYYKTNKPGLFDQLENLPLFKRALYTAVEKAGRTKISAVKWIKNSLRTAFENAIACMPAVMFIGTVSLVLSTYTPVFTWLGYPFLPLLKLLQIPEAAAASPCVVVGFGDMFIPSILASATIESEFTRFVIAVISITQLIYMSEVGPLLLSSKLSIKFKDLVFIFLERTVISLVFATLITRFIIQLMP